MLQFFFFSWYDTFVVKINLSSYNMIIPSTLSYYIVSDHTKQSWWIITNKNELSIIIMIQYAITKIILSEEYSFQQCPTFCFSWITIDKFDIKPCVFSVPYRQCTLATIRRVPATIDKILPCKYLERRRLSRFLGRVLSLSLIAITRTALFSAIVLCQRPMFPIETDCSM